MKDRLLRIARKLSGRARHGYLDQFDASRIAGWAHDAREPGQPALLSLSVDGRTEMTILADMPRDDVVAAGLGPRQSGFDIVPPARLRDGQPHRVVLRLGSDGPVLARRRLPGAGAGPGVLLQAPQEGVAYLDTSGAITGWASGCTQVQIRFDTGPLQPVALDRGVPGLGGSSQQGFRLPVPDALRDGAPHEAHVFFDPVAGAPMRVLDGAPVAFCLDKGQARAEIVDMRGLDVQIRLRGMEDQAAQVVARADGMALDMCCDGALCTLRLPGPCRLSLEDATGAMLAQYDIHAGSVRHSPDPALGSVLSPYLSGDALSGPVLDRARRRFAEFCAAPDARFDPLWYRWSYPDAMMLADRAALLDHYARAGASAGHAPGPGFDEQGARQTYPAIARAIAEGDLPCAFALDLALEGALTRAQARTRHMAEAATELDPPAPRKLPSPSFAQDPTKGIYTAWLARLLRSEAQEAEIIADERALRQAVQATRLAHAPLVSIIMPTWNRAFTIGEAIASVLEQSYQNWELIVCDDASEDRTVDVVRGFDDPRIRYMRFLKSNGAGARNKGLAQARGDYIAYLDSDNLWHPLFLDRMLRALMAHPGQALAYSAYLDTETRGAQVHLDRIARPVWRPTALVSRNFVDLNTIVHHRRLYDWMGGFDTALPRLQDWDLVLRYTSIFRPVPVDHIGVFYRRNIAWGQVTHLFMGSGAQDTVNDKTRRRLEERHETPAVPWPVRSRVTLLYAGPDGRMPDVGTQALLHGLIDVIAPLVEIDLVLPEGLDMPALCGGAVTCHALPADLWHDPSRFPAALGRLIAGRVVIGLGLPTDWLIQLRGCDPHLIWHLESNAFGTCLVSLADPTVVFDLGALPLAAATASACLPARTERPVCLVLGAARERLAATMTPQGFDLLLPPAPLNAGQESAPKTWQYLVQGYAKSVSASERAGLPDALEQVSLVIALGPVAGLSPFEHALLGAQMQRGTPVAMPKPQDGSRSDLARDWVDTKSVYHIANLSPDWIGDKVRKLLGDRAAMLRLSDRAARLHAISWHADLVSARMAHALYRILHDSPEKELEDA